GEVRVPVNGKGQPSAEDVANAIDVFVPPVIDSLMPGEPAIGAGFRHGDSVVAIDGKPVRTWSDLVGIVCHSAEKPLDIDLVRSAASAPLTLHVTPESAQGPAAGTAD